MESKLSRGHSLALKQIREICSSSFGALTIADIVYPESPEGFLKIIFTYDCSNLEKKTGGLPLRHRESFILRILNSFPYDWPTILSTHSRFAGFPHVQWGSQLCLYQSGNEWDSNDGFYGFFERLKWWLEQGAKGELDPIGAPLHPPVTYSFSSALPGVIPLANTPIVTDSPWIGFGELDFPYDHFCEIKYWGKSVIKDEKKSYAPAFLLSEIMPIEFPTLLKDLLTALAERRVSREAFVLQLQESLKLNGENSPIIIIIGTPMRGISGGERVQHISAWKIDIESTEFKALKISLEKNSKHQELREIGNQAEELLKNWIDTTNVKIQWLNVREARPEIIRDRDENSTMKWFKNKTVELWGCGAIGSITGELLVRAGVKKIVLRDEGRVAPGILVRQLYDYEDIHTLKVDALRKRLLRINPSLEVEVSSNDLLDFLENAEMGDAVDFIIDSTGSNPVLEKLEYKRHIVQKKWPTIAGLTIGHEASIGMVSLAPTNFTGGIKDIERKVKIESLKKDWTKKYANEFWPKEPRTKIFQPEPGCSDPTFTGSAVDVISLVSRMLKKISEKLMENKENAYAFFIQQEINTDSSEFEFEFETDHILKDYNNFFQIRVASSAWKEILAWRKKSRGQLPIPETGGVLFGEFNESCAVMWIDEASGPPVDSIASVNEFICGISGIDNLQEYYKESSQGSTQCIGMWHTHPRQLPIPSQVDKDGMKKIFLDSGINPRYSLLLIVGDKPKEVSIFASVFSREVIDLKGNITSSDCQVIQIRELSKKKIGLALSGGGARAMAFHLGCLKALHHRSLLDQVEVISTISGGSVIGAAYAYSNESFEEFEQRVREILRVGLFKKTVFRLAIVKYFFLSLVTFATSGFVAILVSVFKAILSILSFALFSWGKIFRTKLTRFQSPLPRFYNRSDAFEGALNRLFFKNLTMTSPRKNNLDIVINATELKTGTAFRFGSRETGSSRYGYIETNSKIKVSEAVASSACFPVLLPPFEKKYKFRNKFNRVSDQRIHLIDGGVFDNLGITPLDPNRDPRYGTNSFKVDYIISCSAGEGVFGDKEIPYFWHERMIKSFDITFKRVHENSLQILLNYPRKKELKGVVFSYLGQVDKALPGPPNDLVPRDLVNKYPTDFFSMTDLDLELLSNRGEQLTRLLINRYCSEL